ncbi:putative vegetative incompatibility HET containing-domain protein [Podospora fimiseda]|uniref:Vegetative incompatibility HET containing-domain protein n=1 Tax=Podospora fimiseda TaxID=252190 RepID=A0AAN7BLW1_9PEZI|nr:putative vegetative incompatibility HET containing-domain protein [Podospora fimiseda]
MWLINCSNYTLEPNEIDGPDAKPYLILSHTWGDEEVTFKEFTKYLNTAVEKKGFDKIRGICQIALDHGYNYVWVDTCCIDKSSSAELTESINSMFYWYSKADRCIAYLYDLQPSSGSFHPSKDELRRCRWFTRGWTLQELIAPSDVVFYDRTWKPRGSKNELCDVIHAITDIDKDTLMWPGKLPRIPIARKMAWAANRNSTRIEDKAYSLLGLFGIFMPLIYGERERAFIRLQELIAQKTNDMSLFAWRDIHYDRSQTEYSGLFANDPSWFTECTTIARIYDPVIPSPSWIMTNAGIEITTALDWSEISQGYRLYLHCTYSGVDADQDDDPLVLSIWLRKTSSGFVRYKPNEVCLQSQSKTRFGYSSLLSIATSLTQRELSDVVRFYHPQSHLLNSAISFSWKDVASPELVCHQTYHPQHLWDHQQRCFFTSSHSRFIGLVELQISNAWGNQEWKRTCWILCGLMMPTISQFSEWAETSEAGLRPWVMVIKQNDDGSLGGLEGHKYGDLLDPFRLSTIGHKLRARFGSEPPTAGDCVLRYDAQRCLEVSALILSVSEQLQKGRTIEVIIVKSTIS